MSEITKLSTKIYEYIYSILNPLIILSTEAASGPNAKWDTHTLLVDLPAGIFEEIHYGSRVHHIHLYIHINI